MQTMSELVPIRTALLSVSDKTDLVAFATALTARGVRILSTGGTAKTLTEAGISVTPIEKVTGFPEIMDGRVKTLHPLVHGALLGKRDNAEHVAAMKKHGIEPIDLVCINLYPFERTVSQPGVSMAEAIEQIDVGGPAMVRAAAKNAQWVTVVTSPKRYDLVISEMDSHAGSTTPRAARRAGGGGVRDDQRIRRGHRGVPEPPEPAGLPAGAAHVVHQGRRSSLRGEPAPGGRAVPRPPPPPARRSSTPGNCTASSSATTTSTTPRRPWRSSRPSGRSRARSR